MDTWLIADGGSELLAVARRALTEGPQVVVPGGRDEDAVVVVARAEYERLRPEQAPLENRPAASGRELLAFFQNSPLAEAVAAGEIDLDSLRSHDPPREIDFG